MDVYGDDCGKMERLESEILNPGVPTAARNGASSYPGSGAPPEARNGVALLGPGAPSAAATNAVAFPDPDALVPTLGSASPPATRNAASYADWLAAQLVVSGAAAQPPRNAVAYLDGLMPQLNSGATSAAATNGVASPGALVASSLGSAVPRATRNAVSYADWLAAQLGSRQGNAVACAYPEVHLGSHSHHGMLTVGQNAAPSDPSMPVAMAHRSSGMSYSYPGSCAPSASVNGVAYPGDLGAVTKTSENAAGYAIDVYEGEAGFSFDHINPTGIAAAAAGQDGGYDDSSGLPLPFADKVVDDEVWDEDEVAGAVVPERARGVVLGRVGLAATALAVAGITAGGVATPATALGLFAMLIAGVTLVNARVSRT
ncbi:unnamed protein product [Urochloa humidicola]